MSARILIIAGSDSGGGAGIQADIKTVSALGAYAATAVTALTAQNTIGVQAVHGVPPAFITRQMRSVLEDIGADCLKTGMLHDSAVIEAVSEMIQSHAKEVPLVVDPVMVAESGDRLLAAEAVEALRDRLLPQASLVTPNLPEAEALTGIRIRNTGDQEAAARDLLQFGCAAALVKGGHGEGDEVVDVLATVDGIERLVHPRVATRNTHGTGCTIASAIAAGLGSGQRMAAAVRRGRRYLQRALETATPLGSGHGPVNHLHTVMPFDGED